MQRRRRGSCSTRAPRSEADASLIQAVAVDSEAMPLGNATGMTTRERATLARWLASR